MFLGARPQFVGARLVPAVLALWLSFSFPSYFIWFSFGPPFVSFSFPLGAGGRGFGVRLVFVVFLCFSFLSGCSVGVRLVFVWCSSGVGPLVVL